MDWGTLGPFGLGVLVGAGLVVLAIRIALAIIGSRDKRTE